MSFGQAFENKSFSGAIGEISRNETNSVSALFPYTTPYEPGIFVISPLPIFAPQIYSVPTPPENHLANDVIDLYTNFPILIWLYFLFSFCLCSIILLSIHNLTTKQSSSVYKCIKKWCNIWYDYYRLTINNPPVLIRKIISSTLLWICLIFSTYYAFHCILKNTLSADLSVTVPGRWINTFDELLNDHHFSNYTPSIMTAFNMLNVLSMSRNNSVERNLYDKIIQNGNTSLITITKIDHSNPMSYSMNIFKDISDGVRAIIEDSTIFDIMQVHICCHIIPEFASKIKKSKDVIASAPQAMLLSHNTHPQVVKLFSYRSKSGYELGICDGAARFSFRAPMKKIGYNANAKGYQCADNFRGKKLMEILDKDWQPMCIQFFSRLFKLIIYCYIFASIILVIEVLTCYTCFSTFS